MACPWSTRPRDEPQPAGHLHFGQNISIFIRKRSIITLFSAARFFHFAAMPHPEFPDEQEALTAVYLDQDGNVQHLLTLGDGRSDAVSLSLRAIVREALEQDCNRILLLHNHPSGDPRPSDMDIRATRLLCRTTSALHLELVDHLILARNRCFSFRNAGLL